MIVFILLFFRKNLGLHMRFLLCSIFQHRLNWGKQKGGDVVRRMESVSVGKMIRRSGVVCQGQGLLSSCRTVSISEQLIVSSLLLPPRGGILPCALCLLPPMARNSVCEPHPTPSLFPRWRAAPLNPEMGCCVPFLGTSLTCYPHEHPAT